MGAYALAPATRQTSTARAHARRRCTARNRSCRNAGTGGCSARAHLEVEKLARPTSLSAGEPSQENAEQTKSYLYDGQSRFHVWVRDDVGTEYDDWGGACGVSLTKNLFDGEFDVRPAPPPAATWVEIYGYRPDEKSAEHVLRIDLPFPE